MPEGLTDRPAHLRSICTICLTTRSRKAFAKAAQDVPLWRTHYKSDCAIARQ
ncbi:MAG: hypothetical protein MR364_03380 [Oscillospiraceae bacterium]|nr:hypothetical protein [Oscillospiraceae bacterium]